MNIDRMYSISLDIGHTFPKENVFFRLKFLKIFAFDTDVLALVLLTAFILLLFFFIYTIRSGFINSNNKAFTNTKGQNKKESNSSYNKLNEEKKREVLKIQRYHENITEMLAHDLKNPLNIILHQLDHLENNETKQSISDASNLMMNMLQNVLDVQKYNNSSLPLNLESINLAELLQDVLRSVELMSKKKNLNIRYKSDFTYWVTCDCDVIHRVLINVLINLIKYCDNNEVVFINSETQDKSLKISISANIKDENIQTVSSYLHNEDLEITESKSSSFLRILFFKLALQSHNEEYGIEKTSANIAKLWFTLPLLKLEEKSVLNQIQNELEEIEINHAHKIKLEFYIDKLRQHSIYELSKIKGIIKEIPDLDDSVIAWRKELNESLTSINEQRFIYLLDSVSKTIQQHEK